MKVIIELPEWTKDTFIKVLANTELVAWREPGEDQPIHIKTVRCNRCGACCMGLWGGAPFGHDDEGNCLKLRKNGDEWECTAGSKLPIACLGDPIEEPDCVIEYRRQN
jgi:hypothetical protein